MQTTQWINHNLKKKHSTRPGMGNPVTTRTKREKARTCYLVRLCNGVKRRKNTQLVRSANVQLIRGAEGTCNWCEAIKHATGTSQGLVPCARIACNCYQSRAGALCKNSMQRVLSCARKRVQLSSHQCYGFARLCPDWLKTNLRVCRILLF